MLSLALLALPLLSPQDPPPPLRMPAYLSDHAVLQRGVEAPIWGWAPPGALVHVSSSWGPAADVKTGADGRWRVLLPTPAAETKPQTIWVESATGSATLADLLFGDVWVCGGQSNMEWALGSGAGEGVEGWKQAAAAANYPGIRWFEVTKAVGAAPAEDCQGAWVVCTPQTAPAISAVGFFFGRALHGEIGAPIGLIGCNWGGTPAEAWTSETYLARHGAFKDALARLQEARNGTAQPTLAQLQTAWWQNLAQKDPGSKEGWQRPETKDADWAAAALPGPWDTALNGFDGVVWYRREIEIPQDWVGRDLVVELGPIDDCDDVWADGVPCGGLHADGQWQTPRVYGIGAQQVTDTRLVLAIRAVDTGGAGGLVGAPASMKIYRKNFADKFLPLAGPWKLRVGASMGDLGAFPRQNWLGPGHPAALFNGMVAPLLAFPIRGAIFYQGEANVGNPEQYATLFPDMIASWRAAWGRGDFPFYWVQIAPFTYGAGELAARLREAQDRAQAVVKNGGMAVTMDVGDPRDIHPLKKRQVGERLARCALAGAYGRADLESHGPELDGQRREGGQFILAMRHAAGLKTLDGKAPSHFQLAGADRVFHPASATIVGATIVLACAEVPEPVAARYAWGEADIPNLVNGAGLPASSFRTDDWPRP